MPDAKKIGWVYVLVQFIIIGAILFFSNRDRIISVPGRISTITGLAVILTGLILAIFSFINFGQIVTPNPVPMDNYSLKTTGMYKYIRHPIYSSVLLSLLGFVILSQSISGIIFWIIGVLFIAFKTRFEEDQLILKFPEYISYRTRTKKLIPFIY
jgi:protein-S-isoprenylcysteine O-methyltransferase Ste14